MKANLRVKIMVNGTPFHYGRLLASYTPLPNDDGYTQTRNGIVEDAVAATQRPHIWIDPTNSQGGELLLPFFWYENGIDLPIADFDALGRIDFLTINTLKHALGKTSSVHITVYAWAEDVHFAIPTQVNIGSISPQAEYTKGPVSRAATTVATVADMLGSAPTIGVFAKATSIAASSVAKISSLFGYSNPPKLEYNMVRPSMKPNMATSSGLDDVTKLTLDPKSETTLDTRLLGLTGQDEMTVNSIATRESFLTTFSWPITATTDDRLFASIVDPCLRANRSGAGGLEMHFPACCFAAMPFKYWRGTMKFRFQVICSKYHKGRIAVSWDPVSDLAALAGFETQTNYTTIVDISDTTDFTVEVGWGQTTSYREHLPVMLPNSSVAIPQTTMFNTSALAYNSSTVEFGNGVVSVFVLNELAVPDDTIDADVSINVFVSMADDFQVAAPCSTYLNMLRTSTAALPKTVVVEPQAEIVTASEESQRYDSQPGFAPTVDTVGPCTAHDNLNDFYFGEVILSFRQLLKRYVMAELVNMSVWNIDPEYPAGAPIIARCAREAMPFEPMYCNTNIGETFDVRPVEGGTSLFAYAFMTPIRYLTLGFGGWRGTLRQQLVDACLPYEYIGASKFNTTPISASWRTGACANYTNASNVFNFLLPGAKGQYYAAYWDNEGMSGTAITQRDVNPTLTVEVPYFTPYRFAPAKKLPRFTADVTTSINTALPVEQGKTYFEMVRQSSVLVYDAPEGSPNFPTLHRYVAAGEDFNLFYYLGPPVFFASRVMPAA
nr:MAG: hypothetical protein 2 [Salisharnavirus sp.]